jgi:predicted HAD superfamily Cof-like phosphohydrolase
MTTNFLRVKEFNEVFGHAAPTIEQYNIFKDEPSTVNLRNSLIHEEISELREALENEDVVEIIDAISDIQYVAYGLLVVYGVNGDIAYTKYMDTKYELLKCVRNNEIKNLTNFNQTHEFISSILNGGSIDSTPKNFLDRYTEASFRCSFDNYIDELVSAYNDLEKATNSQNFDDTILSVLSIIYITYVIGALVSVDVDESVRLVHESNMSKICSSKEEAEQTVIWYRENEHRYDSPAYKNTEVGFVIYNESTGKILKNINYKPVDLTMFLA